MRSKLTDFFSAPVFIDDEEKTRRAKALNALQIYMGGAVLVLGCIGVLFIFEEKIVSSMSLFVGILITIIGVNLNRQGRVALASTILLATLWINGVYLMAMSGGIQSQHIMIFVSGTVVAGILLGVRGGLYFAGYSIIIVLGFVIAQQMGYQFPNTFPMPPLSIWSILVMYLSFTIIPLQVTFQSLSGAASRALASEERYRLITSVMSDYAFFSDFGPDGTLSEQWVTGAFESITGYTPEEYFARGGWTSILHPDSRDDDDWAMEKLYSNQKASVDSRIIRMDGELRWVRSFAHPKWDNKRNRLTGIYGAVKDITEQKRFESSLQQREAILEVVAHTANLFLRTPDWRTEIDAFLERLGKTMNVSHAYLFENHLLENGELGKSMRYEWSDPSTTSDLGNPQYINNPLSSPEIEYWYGIMKQEFPYIGDKNNIPQREMDSLHRDGIESLLDVPIIVDGVWWGIIGFDDVVNEREWSHAEVDALKVAANAIGAAIQRQSTDDALKFSEEKFSRAFHTTPVLMTIENESSRFLDANQAFMDTFGLIREEIIGRTASELKIIYDTDDLIAMRQAFQESRTLRDFEIRFRNESGKTGVALLSSEKFRVGNTEYTLTSGLDITDRKQAELERERLIGELESKNEELERFTYTVSHDLKSPLVTINGFIGYLEQDAASGNTERLKKDVQRIQEAVNKMQKLLSELLELSRIGRLMNASETVSFEKLVHEAMGNVHGQLEARGVEIQIQPNLPRVYGDSQRLIEVLQNLLDNAAKYMGDQVDPQIEVGQDGEEDGKPIFFVKDNGMGIDPEYHERIFGLFNKLDAKSEGTGVGLALVKRIVEVHEGRIWVESEASPQGDVGTGSTFYFTLPIGPSA